MRDRELAALIVTIHRVGKTLESNKSPLPGYRNRSPKNQ